MIAIGKSAFNEKDVQYVWWSSEGHLVVEFYNGDYALIKNPVLGNLLWELLIDHKTEITAEKGEVEWVYGKRGIRGNQ